MGQIPFTDFTAYLGMGVLILNAPLLLINNTFTTSLFVTTFSNYICFAIFIVVLLSISSRNKIFGFIGGAGSAIFVFIIPKIADLSTYFPFVNLYSIGNSMRMERAFLPIILVSLLVIYLVINHKNIFDLCKSWKFNSLVAFIAGVGIVWSNDYGFACIGSTLLILVFLQWYTQRKVTTDFLRNVSVSILAILVGILTGACMVTCGHPLSYITSVFGTAGFQYWYYGLGGGGKLYSVLDIFRDSTFTVYLILFGIICIHYIFCSFKRTLNQYNVVTCFILLSTFIASALYCYASGGFAYEAFSLSICVVLTGLGYRIVSKIVQVHIVKVRTPINYDLIKTICTILLTLIVIFAFIFICVLFTVPTISSALNDERSTYYYSEELGGYIPAEYASSLYYLENIIGDERVFSTYASALEVLLNQYQPTGTDYIIHALGFEKQEEYVNNFVNENYEYVATINYNFVFWEQWISRANWFFYSKLYENYIPYVESGYNVLWKKSDHPTNVINPDIQIDSKKVSDSQYTLTFTTESKDNLVADLYVSYYSEYDLNPYRLTTFKRLVSVTDSHGGLYNIPESYDGYCLPVFITDGVGTVNLVSNPSECTSLVIDEVKIGNIYPNYYYY